MDATQCVWIAITIANYHNHSVDTPLTVSIYLWKLAICNMIMMPIALIFALVTWSVAFVLICVTSTCRFDKRCLKAVGVLVSISLAVPLMMLAICCVSILSEFICYTAVILFWWMCRYVKCIRRHPIIDDISDFITKCNKNTDIVSRIVSVNMGLNDISDDTISTVVTKYIEGEEKNHIKLSDLRSNCIDPSRAKIIPELTLYLSTVLRRAASKQCSSDDIFINIYYLVTFSGLLTLLFLTIIGFLGKMMQLVYPLFTVIATIHYSPTAGDTIMLILVVFQVIFTVCSYYVFLPIYYIWHVMPGNQLIAIYSYTETEVQNAIGVWFYSNDIDDESKDEIYTTLSECFGSDVALWILKYTY
eukprot:265718_1